MSDDVEKKVLNEVIRRARLQEKTLRQLENRNINDQAIRETLLETSDLTEPEIDDIIGQVRAEFEKKSEVISQSEQKPAGKGISFAVLSAVLLIFIVIAVFRILPDSQIPSSPDKPIQTVSKPAEKPSVKPGEPATLSGDRQKGLNHIKVSIGGNEFFPVIMKLTASRSAETNPLTGQKPSGIIKEPDYKSSYQRYGHLYLGADSQPFYYVFDVVDGPHPLLYFDINADGDLTNDGGPILNRGTGWFSASLDIPFDYLFPVKFPGTFQIWFFSRSDLWEKGETAHYSRTQLQGTVRIDETSYPAYLVDRGINDADLTNDGIFIDVNGDGQINTKTEHILPGKTKRINGKPYTFDITW